MIDLGIVLNTLSGLSGDAFWTAYHTQLTPYQQLIAQGELEWDFFCWSPGPDNWHPQPIHIVPPPPPIYIPPITIPIVEPPPYIPPPISTPIPETSTWLMLILGLCAMSLAYHRRRRHVPRYIR